MPFKCHHLDKWEYMNLDLCEEVLEHSSRCVVFIGGASSSGKSFCAKNLKRVLEGNGHKALVVSTDNYNKGISGIITDKVAEKYFGGDLPNREKVVREVKSVLLKTPFSKKFDRDCLDQIKPKLASFLAPADLSKYLDGCAEEIKHLNFDEPDVYDLSSVATDIKALLAGKTVSCKKYSKVVSEQVPAHSHYDGSKYQVLIVEGIYVLSDHLLDRFDRGMAVTNFIEGSPKSLFLRRVIRDNKITSSPSYYTIGMYFHNIVKSYNETIIPSRDNAMVIFNNDMTFAELREGNLYLTKDRVKVTNPLFIQEMLNKAKLLSTTFQKDIYFTGIGEPSDFNNLLRLRELSTDGGKTYVPSSLVNKGSPKARRDGKVIRPINVLLKEGDFFKVFGSEKDFLDNMTAAGFAIDRQVFKVKRRITYDGYRFTISDFRGEGVWLEFADPDLPLKVRDEFISEASE